ncbi:glycosyltransferase involved in cell wall biosynthesis [Idiomarina fontislapidosi]|uniref:Glycosyltransferase 2-like domain-containing protein n=1 Tax=Idiomarina fontislapidosi TaxID=263723 RepID=A0A432XY82_9GAMM|nr:glycosyltransferase [Idiomarina fontislapidosi]PYE32835.1 glycosyltransferase involved in cell wall biosynthesis [Idiomarina fontislapidosi]RUO53725.1 hypothetical protein CWE25_07500 [Idiomarina fontislapidosi]
MKQLLSALFNEQHYKSAYVDIRDAGFDSTDKAFLHYLKHGRFEGRWPAAFRSVDNAHALWSSKAARSTLTDLIQHSGENDQLSAQADAQLARWFLAQYYGSVNEWDAVVQLLGSLTQAGGLALLRALVPHPGPFLCLFNAFLRTEQIDAARALLESPLWPLDQTLYQHDHDLARSMLTASTHEKLAAINRIYQSAGIAPLTSDATTLSFDTVSASSHGSRPQFWQRQPKVSVIVPCYNCADTLETAVMSLCRQRWHRLQIILVDDASTDATFEVMTHLAQRDKRIAVLQLTANEGPYGARNAGLGIAKGQLITTHDSDDWSHPDKIACQVEDLLRHPGVMANRTAWVRADNDLNFSRWRPESSWIYPNVSSLMFRRAVFKRLGYWDTVKADGDTEFYNRVIAEFGAHAVREVMPAVPLALGRVDTRSLTQAKPTHVSSMLAGVRNHYQRAATHWHQSTRSRYLMRYPQQRAFLAPLTLCRGTPAAQLANALDHLQTSPLFDADYYRERYPDIVAAGIDPALHYLKFGGGEGRDPSARFSSSGYAFIQALASDENPLVHYLTQLESDNAVAQTPELFIEQSVNDSSKPTMMVVAHSTSGNAFGAEKSLLDVLAMLGEHYRLWVVLPGALNSAYVTQVLQLSDKLSFLPLRWWQSTRTTDTSLVETLASWMDDVDQVYINTLTLHEPLLAAQQAKRRCTVHVRELPEHDRALCDTLAASPELIRRHVLQHADVLIANSRVVADSMQAPEKTFVVPNVIRVENYSEAQTDLPDTAAGQPLKVAMLSSNLAKKGVKDFYQLAAALKNDVRFEWHLLGPETEDLAHARQSYPHAHVNSHGYVANPVDALKQCDVVLNLSHFQESFGRSVLEAFAAGKLVVVYDWGALTDLVSDDAGIRVPLGDHEALAHALVALYNQPEQMQSFRRCALKRAKQFAPDIVKAQLLSVLARSHESHNE